MPGLLSTSKLVATPLNPTSKSLRDVDFGVVISGVSPGELSQEQLAEFEQLLYKHSVVVFKDVDLTPKGQYSLHHFIDPAATSYGHSKVGRPDTKPGVINDSRDLPEQPEVHLLGHGVITDDKILRGLKNPFRIQHPMHHSFHKEIVSKEDEAKGIARFYRFHQDAALYDKNPPKMTSLYAMSVPKGKTTIRYDDGTGDEIPNCPLGGTAFVSSKVMFNLLPPAYKSLAIRGHVRYAPYSYSWISPAKSRSNGLGMISEGKETPLEDLPPWEESKIKIFPMVWTNPVDGTLQFQCNPSNLQALIIDPLPEGVEPTGDTLYPNGATITDLAEARELMYKMQRPAISPEHLYIHDWDERDFVCFHNRGLLHCVTGTYPEPEEMEKPRALYQCNLAASVGVDDPSPENVRKYAI